MKKEITHIDVWQAARIVAILTLIITIIIFFPLALVLILSGERTTWPLFFAPLFYTLVAFLATALHIWLYNIVAKKIGGIKLHIKNLE